MALRYTLANPTKWFDALTKGIVGKNGDIAYGLNPCGATHTICIAFVSGYWRPNPKPGSHSKEYKQYQKTGSCGGMTAKTGYKVIQVFANGDYFNWTPNYGYDYYNSSSAYPGNQPAHNSNITSTTSAGFGGNIKFVCVPNSISTTALQSYFNSLDPNYGYRPTRWFQPRNRYPPFSPELYLNDFSHTHHSWDSDRIDNYIPYRKKQKP